MINARRLANSAGLFRIVNELGLAAVALTFRPSWCAFSCVVDDHLISLGGKSFIGTRPAENAK